MRKNATVRKFLAALLCVCLAVGNFGWVGTAKAVELPYSKGNEVISPLNTRTYGTSSFPNSQYNNGESYTGKDYDQVTLLVGENNPLAGKTLEETFENYKKEYLLGIAADFCIFLKESFGVTNSDAEGRIAVGGDFNADFAWGVSYAVGAGDYEAHAPLESLLVNLEREQNRKNAATAIIGGQMNGQISDVYYDTVEGVRSKFEANDNANAGCHGMLPLTPERKSEKKLVINHNLDTNDQASLITYLNSSFTNKQGMSGTRVPVESFGNWQKIDQTQTYVTQLIDFDEQFKTLEDTSADLAKVSDEFEIKVKYTHFDTNKNQIPNVVDGNGNMMSTIEFTYKGAPEKVDCVYVTLTPEQYEWFKAATYVEYNNIPDLTAERYVINTHKITDDINFVKWESACIIVSMPGIEEVYIADRNVAEGNKCTTINGDFISRSYPAEDDLSKNNQPGVTSLLYNFPDTTKLVIGSNFQGTLFAPKANVTDQANLYGSNSGHLSGALIAKSFYGATQFGYRPFAGSALMVTGELAITKTVEGEDADLEQPFTFTITVDPAITGKRGDMTFTDGVATVTLTHGETKVATGLFGGTKYTIVETGVTGYIPSVKEQNSTGVIASDQIVNVEFVNHYINDDETGDDNTGNEDDNTGDEDDNTGDGNTDDGNNGEDGNTGDEDDNAGDDNTGDTGNEGEVAEVGSLSVSKTVTGEGADKTKAFRFTVTLSQQLTQKFGEMSFVNGVATFTLKDGESMQATGLPAGVTYTVVEDSADSYVTTKSGDTGAITADKKSEAIFINAYVAEETKTEVPKTGDAFPLTMWLSLTMLAMVGLYLARKGKKN